MRSGETTKKHLETPVTFLVDTQRSQPVPRAALTRAMGAGMILLCGIRVVELEQDRQDSSLRGVCFSREMCSSDILLH